jgi:predicted NAD/FAD-binding protein
VPHSPGTARPQAAVVGAGVAGLTAAYLLQRSCDVTLYETGHRLGGHAHTHDITTSDGRLVSGAPRMTGQARMPWRSWPSGIGPWCRR